MEASVSLSDFLFRKTGKAPRQGTNLDAMRANNGVGKTAEWRRIEGLPLRDLTEAIPDLTELWRIENSGCAGCELCRKGSPSLRSIQSLALLQAEACGGLFGPIGVGHGKSLCALLLPDALEAQRAVILTKPRLKTQLTKVDIPRYAKHFKLPIDRITVVAYSELSIASGTDILERLQPDLIVADEAHSLRHKASARTKRFLRYMKAHPQTKFCALSGTMATRSIRDYQHLLELALGAGSPLPGTYYELQDWARVLDSEQPEGTMPMRAGALLDLCGADVRLAESQIQVDQGQTDSLEAEKSVARRVYRRRLTESFGVVATEEGSVDCSLVISRREVVVPDVIKKALKTLRETWSIEGEELQDAKDIARIAKQLACGFYYRWVWPNGVKDFEWLDARAAWHKEVRHVLTYRSRPGLDSPMLVARAAERGEIASVAWDPWKQVRARYKPHPAVEAVWLSDFLVNDVVNWLAKCTADAPGIVWYSHDAFGVELERRGLSVFGPGAAGDRIVESRLPGVVASIEAHKEGKNLQQFSRNLIMVPPANGTAFEQLIGRSHRPGQLADEVSVDVMLHDPSLVGAWEQALEDARFVEETQGSKQKLLYAERIGL